MPAAMVFVGSCLEFKANHVYSRAQLLDRQSQQKVKEVILKIQTSSLIILHVLESQTTWTQKSIYEVEML